MAPKLTWTPIGGLGEIGKNMMAFEYGDDIMIVDTGIMFPESDMFGIDAVIPDFSLLKEKRDRIRGIVVTHGHEDHTGAVSYVVKEFPGVPIYATPLTRGLLEVKLREAKAMDKTTLTAVPTNGSVQIGAFKVEFFRMCHSIPDNVGLGITTPLGLIVHSGDFKFDHTPVDGQPSDFAKLAEFAGRGVLALLSDSTNAENPGFTPSEREIEPALELVFRDAGGRIIVATFASLISRIQQVANICEIYGRKLAIAGASMADNVRMAQKMGYLQLPDGLLVKLEETNKMKAEEVCIMATGSQGEPSAVVGRIATGRHQVITAMPGDTYVLSAHPIPGNEEAIHRIINRLFQKGANVIYPQLARVHVSGHASQEEQKLLLGLVKPRYFIPIHGELRQLYAHRRLALSLGIPAENIFVGENGMPVEFSDNGARQLDRIPGGYVFVDGSGVGDIGPIVLKDREALARDGFVLVVVRRDAKGGLLQAPEIITRGFVYLKESEELIKAIAQTAADELKNMKPGMSDDDVRTRAGEAVSKQIANETRRKPMVIVIVA